MFKNFRDKMALSGITVLMIGIVLLIFTFVSAYGFLTAGLAIIASEDLVRTFGEALAPLIATCIRIMYLGVMGWIGSLITIRGVTIIAHTPQPVPAMQQKEPMPEPKPQPQPQQPQPQKPKVEKPKEEKPKEEKPKEVPTPPEPEIVVIPPEPVTQEQPQTPQKHQPQNNSSPPPSNNQD
ncbi:MAG: hypothetical protein WAN53_02850 [Candidatus Bathyarchaeia archaeon]